MWEIAHVICGKSQTPAVATHTLCSLRWHCLLSRLEDWDVLQPVGGPFDGVQLSCSPMVDSISSPSIGGSGDRIPLANLISKITQPWCTRSFKLHFCCLHGPRYITPNVQCIYQSPPPGFCRLDGWEMGRAHWPNMGFNWQGGWMGQENVRLGKTALK